MVRDENGTKNSCAEVDLLFFERKSLVEGNLLDLSLDVVRISEIVVLCGLFCSTVKSETSRVVTCTRTEREIVEKLALLYTEMILLK
jgi:hypothetical protein